MINSPNANRNDELLVFFVQAEDWGRAEELFLQEIRLHNVLDPNSVQLSLIGYQLATLLYVRFAPCSQAVVTQARQLCHRLGFLPLNMTQNLESLHSRRQTTHLFILGSVR